jgi:ABC-type transporter Mla maintaining outer membrane lipid asymmetry permease subunit MlaE
LYAEIIGFVAYPFGVVAGLLGFRTMRDFAACDLVAGLDRMRRNLGLIQAALLFLIIRDAILCAEDGCPTRLGRAAISSCLCDIYDL